MSIETKLVNTHTCAVETAEKLNVDIREVYESLLKTLIDKKGQLYYFESSEKQDIALYADELVDTICDLIVTGDITFPYKHYYMDVDYIYKTLEQFVVNFDEVKEKKLQGTMSTNNKLGKSLRIDTDNDVKFIYEYFKEKYDKHLDWKNAVKNREFVEFLYKKGDITPEYLNNSYYYAFDVKRYAFNPCIAKSIFAILGARRICDVSMLNCECLLAAISVVDNIQHYVGFSLSSNEQAVQDILLRYAKTKKNIDKFRITHSNLDASTEFPRNTTFDCIVFRPTFIQYPDIYDVVRETLKRITVAWDNLEVGGYLVLSLCDLRQWNHVHVRFSIEKYTHIVLLYLNAYFKGVDNYGAIQYKNYNNTYEAWILRKTNGKNTNSKAFTEFKNTYSTFNYHKK